MTLLAIYVYDWKKTNYDWRKDDKKFTIIEISVMGEPVKMAPSQAVWAIRIKQAEHNSKFYYKKNIENPEMKEICTISISDSLDETLAMEHRNIILKYLVEKEINLKETKEKLILIGNEIFPQKSMGGVCSREKYFLQFKELIEKLVNPKTKGTSEQSEECPHVKQRKKRYEQFL